MASNSGGGGSERYFYPLKGPSYKKESTRRYGREEDKRRGDSIKTVTETPVRKTLKYSGKPTVDYKPERGVRTAPATPVRTSSGNRVPTAVQRKERLELATKKQYETAAFDKAFGKKTKKK